MGGRERGGRKPRHLCKREQEWDTGIQVREGHKREGQRILQRAAGKDRQAQNIVGQEIRTQLEAKTGVSGSRECCWWEEKNHSNSLGKLTH